MRERRGERRCKLNKCKVVNHDRDEKEEERKQNGSKMKGKGDEERLKDKNRCNWKEGVKLIKNGRETVFF